MALFFTNQSLGSEKKVTITSTEFPPLTSEHLENYGYLTDIVIQAFEKVGYKVQIELYPWARALKYAQNGQVDGILAWYKKDREKWFVYSYPLPPNLMGFYKHKENNINFDKNSGLKPYTIGVVRGYATPPEFEKLNLSISPMLEDVQMLRMLSKKRIDLAFIDKTLARYLINTKVPALAKSIEWMEPAVTINTNYVAFSKKVKNYKALLLDFNLGMVRLSEEGGVRMIMEKYGVGNVEM